MPPERGFQYHPCAFYSQPITREGYNGARPGVRYNSTDAPSE